MNKSFSRTLFALALTAALLGCSTVTPTPVPERQYTPAPTQAAAVASPPATGVPATATPAASPTPQPPHEPRLLRYAPARGEEQRVDAPIVLEFDQEMDPASVQAAFAIEPPVAGTWEWREGHLAHFKPQGEFARDETYRVTLAETAKNVLGMPLRAPVAFSFRTVGYLDVAAVFPAADSTQVATSSAIRVIFNRPVVPLSGVQDQAGLPTPVRLDPPVQGKGEWVNTATYSLTPTAPLQPGITYQAVIPAALADATGGVLLEDYAWQFTTELPAVLSTEPFDGATFVSPATDVRVTFNTAMDRADVEGRFRLSKEGQTAPLAGRFGWVENTLLFTPTARLEPGAAYALQLQAGSKSVDGKAAVDKAVAAKFTVAALPEVLSVRPRDGQTQVSLGQELQIRFNSPMDASEKLTEHLTIVPTTTVWTYWTDNDTVAHLYGGWRASTTYTVTLKSGLPGRYGDKLAKGLTWSFRTAPYTPSVTLRTPGSIGLYSSYGEPKVFVSHRNVSRLTLSLYSLTAEQTVAATADSGWPEFGKVPRTDRNLIKEWTVPVSAQVDVLGTLSVTLTTDRGAPLPAGFYFLSAGAPEAGSTEEHLLVVSPYNLTLKSNEKEALVWATDLKSGQPVADLELSLYGAGGKRLAQAKTDRDGIARFQYEEQEPWTPLLVLGRKDGNIAVVLSQWSDGVSVWDYRLEGSWYVQKVRAHFFTERQIYRPGQTVYLKGIVRLDDDGRYSLPPKGQKVRITATDASGREFWQENLPLSEVGSFDGEILLSENAPLGYYSLRAELGEQMFETSFQVAEYRKPEFQAALTVDRSDYVQGDTVRAVVEASYFFGGPVQKAAVTWRVYRAPYYFDRWQGEGWYSFADYDSDRYDWGGFVTEGRGETNTLGQYAFDIPANIADLLQSQIYTIEASVVDINNQEVTARAYATIHKGDFYIGLTTDQYVGAANEAQAVRLITVDTQGVTRTQQALTVTFFKHEWYSVKEKAPDGSDAFYWTNKVRDTAVATVTVQTDRNGVARASFTPKEGGTYKVVASGRDRSENQVRSALYLWVSDRAWVNWGQENHDRITLVADKKSYSPGDTARILVPSPYQGSVKALLTIERGGILEYKVLTLTSNSELLQVPITAAHAPNIFVSVVLVKGADAPGSVASFKMGYVMLPVSTEQQQLRVTVAPDRDAAYRPRDTVTYQITTQDYRGNGVPAETTLQLVDLAVETLVGGQAPDIVATFYRQRGLGVRTGVSLVRSVDRVNLTIAEEGKGGGGGDGGEMVREAFPDTAFWAPAVQTDAQGKATVRVTLPDNLTTWRLRAQAVTADTRVGQAVVDIVTNLELMVRPIAPRFAVVGDQPILGAVVHNNTDRALEVAVKLTAEGMRIERSEQTVRVPAWGREAVRWPASVVATHEAVLQWSASGGGLSDAVRLTLPIYYPNSPETVGTSGQVQDRVTEWVRLPANADPSLGELSVTLEPSLAAAMQEGLRYLTAYPYDCIEQTVSRFLPNVFTYRALKGLGLRNPTLETRLPQQVATGLQRIYSLQNLDGGWGWWTFEASSPMLTAYVLLGLHEAKRADFLVHQPVMDAAAGFLRQWLDQEPQPTRRARDERAFVLYVLAEVGQGDLGRTVLLYDQRADMSLYAKAYLAMTLALLDPTEASRLTTLTNELANAALLSATGAHWEETVKDKWAMNTDTRTTAIILRALVAVSPRNPLLPNVVRWLMTARSTGRWETTQENVWAIWGLTDYMVATGELQADYAYSLLINGVGWAEGRVTAENVEEAVLVRAPVGRLLAGGDNAVTLERKGELGRLYYSAYLRYYLPAEELKALGRGVYIERSYALADDPSKPISEAQVNDILTVKLTIIAPNDLYYLVVEDPLPAGCEALDTSLATTRSVEESRGLERMVDDKGLPEQYGWWWGFWPTHTELRDEKVALFATQVSRGAYEYTYQVRCTTPGEFKVLPAVAYEMYEPDVFGRSAGGLFVISE